MQTAEESDLRGLVEETLKKRKIASGKVLFAMLAGSWAFNLNVESSDKDYFGGTQLPPPPSFSNGAEL